MRKIRIGLLLAVLCSYGYTQAQSVAINSTGATANSSAMLDVSATNKGILIPNVSLASLTDATTISSPATSLLVYNTNTAIGGGAGYYYNAGTSASPAWTMFQASSGVAQSSTTYFSTAGLSLSTATVTYLPGFPVTVNIPANAVVLMSVTVGAQTTSTSTTGASVVDIIGLVDGPTAPPAGCYQRLFITNNTTYTTQTRPAGFTQAFSLTPGNHTFGIGAYLAGGSTVTVGGNSSSVMQGSLTLTILKTQ